MQKPPFGEAFIFAIIFLIIFSGGIGVKRGFSLVELLIVLAVLVALISSVTVLAMNAIRKAKATQLAQNLKTLTKSVEDRLYLEGFDSLSDIVKLTDIVRDVRGNYKLFLLIKANGEAVINAVYNDLDVNAELVNEILPDATDTNMDITHTLQSGEFFYRITTYVLKSNVSGNTVTLVPRDSIYLSSTVHIY